MNKNQIDNTSQMLRLLKRSASQTIMASTVLQDVNEEDEEENTFAKQSYEPWKPHKKKPRRLFGLLKILRRLSVWMTIFLAINYRYWTGRIQFPLSCNLVGVNCPSWPVVGTVVDGYEPVVESFKQNFVEGLEVGASFAAYVGQEPVVELYGGYHNKRYRKPYDASSLQLVFSSSKFVESFVITYLVDQGLIDFDDKISKYWPEFAYGNKENVTLSCLLGHRAGVTYLNRQPTFKQIANLDLLADLLAKQPHNFNGQKVQGYHAVTRGWYLNEIVRRVDPQHRTLGQIIRQEIMPKLDIEFYLGIPIELEHRISPLVGYPALRTLAKALLPSKYQKESLPPGFLTTVFDRRSLKYKAVQGSNPKQSRIWPHTHNRREIWGSEGPSYSGITNARSLAKLAAVLANQGQLDSVKMISKSTVLRALKPLPWMPDAVVSRNVTFAQGGFGVGLKFPGSDLEWLGWGGVGGSMVFFNPETKISFSYVMNSMTLAGIGDHRSFALISKLVECYYKTLH